MAIAPVWNGDGDAGIHFQVAEGCEIYGFTTERNGGNLPAEYGPWTPKGGHTLQAGDGIAGIASAEAVMEGIKRNGFLVARSGEVNVTHFPIPPRGVT